MALIPHGRCELCWPREDNVLNSVQCANLQRQQGCHSCGRVGCWSTKRACLFYNRDRENHPDAGVGDDVAHIHQMHIEILKDGEALQTGRILAPMWWIGHRIVIRIEGLDYFVGAASGDGCNCLVDSLRQCFNMICNVSYVRQVLEDRHRGKNSQIEQLAYLQLDFHWRDILELLAQHNLCERSFDVNDCRIVCVDMNLPGHGDVVGSDGAHHILYICRQNMNHFVPLFRLRGSAEPMACEDFKGAPSNAAPDALPGVATSAFSSQAQSSSACVSSSAAESNFTNATENSEWIENDSSSRCVLPIT